MASTQVGGGSIYFFFASALLCWELPMVARYLFIGIFMIHLIIDKIYQKKILRIEEDLKTHQTT